MLDCACQVPTTHPPVVSQHLATGSAADAQRLDSLTEDDALQRFVLSYSFPPSSVGETGRVGGVQGRREVGHGARL